MAGLPPEDMTREIDRLWARLGASPEPGSAPSLGGSGADIAWETVAMLKAQQRRRESALSEALEAKAQALEHWRLRAQALEAEASELRAASSGGEERAFVELLDAQRKLEESARVLELERARHEEERRRLESLLAETRDRVAAEAQRAREAEARWAKREQQSLLDLKDLQETAGRRQAEAAQADESVRALKAGMADAKTALEKTLAELLLERRERARAEDAGAAANRKTEEVERHLSELQRLWEEERAQWRELWERERSTWEAQRQELAQWEESLRREREAWHGELREKEKVQLAFTDGLTGKLRETTQTAEQVARRMAELESREENERAAGARAEDHARRVAAGRLRRARGAALALAAAAVLAGALPGWRWAREWRFEPQEAAPVAAANPTALGFDGERLWVADWSGRLFSADPADPRAPGRQAAPALMPPYHPAALAFGGGAAWALDSAQGRLVKLDPAGLEKTLGARPSPGPAPTAAAFDGEALWTYDAANRAVYRHAGDEVAPRAYPVAEDLVPSAMAWVDGELWLADSKSKRLYAYRAAGGRLSLLRVQKLPDAALLGLISTGAGRGRSVWALLGASPDRAQPELKRYTVRRRFAIF